MESHETPESQPSVDEARAALESIAEIRKETARSAASPKGFYSVVGVGEGLLVAAVGSEHSIRYLVFLIGLAIIFGGMMWYSKVTGTVSWAKIWEPWAWRAWIMVIVAIVALLVAVELGQPWATIGGAVTALVWTLVGPAFDRTWVSRQEVQR